MKIIMANNILSVIITSLFLFSSSVQAEQSLHLLFHMGVGLNGEFYIGGTLENKGETDVYAGFIVVTPFDKNCHPKIHCFYPLASPLNRVINRSLEFLLKASYMLMRSVRCTLWIVYRER